jgi:hypothetical protein
MPDRAGPPRRSEVRDHLEPARDSPGVELAELAHARLDRLPEATNDHEAPVC